MKTFLLKRIYLWPAAVLLLQGCGINSNLMWKTPKDWEKYADETMLIDTNNRTKDEYRLDVNDIIQMRFFLNDGIKILDITSSVDGGTNNQAQFFNPNLSMSYVIQKDSLVKIPILLGVNLVGKTIREAERYLEGEYNDYYEGSFVQLTVTNRRVTVFPGNGGQAQVLYLANNNTTLMEAIALAGGIAERGRAARVKLMRKGEDGRREVYKINLAVIDHLDYADIVVKANDYIYIEPVPEIGREVLAEVTPIVSLISSAAVVVSVVSLIK